MGAPFQDASDAQSELMFGIKVQTLLNALRAAVPRLIAQGRGAVANVGAYGAYVGMREMNAHRAAKSRLVRLAEDLAGEVRHGGVNVNGMLQTMIDTPPNRGAMRDADPNSRVAPHDLANVICLLGSDAAETAHGALVPESRPC